MTANPALSLTVEEVLVAGIALAALVTGIVAIVRRDAPREDKAASIQAELERARRDAALMTTLEAIANGLRPGVRAGLHDAFSFADRVTERPGWGAANSLAELGVEATDNVPLTEKLRRDLDTVQARLDEVERRQMVADGRVPDSDTGPLPPLSDDMLAAEATDGEPTVTA